LKVIDLVKDRCTLLPDFITQSEYFFAMPASYDVAAVKGKWTTEKVTFFNAFSAVLTEEMSAADMEEKFKELAAEHTLKPGELMLPFRIMLVGGKFGPGVFDIAFTLGIEETRNRILAALAAFE
jgi:glutamyl-tRNA synthetase